MSRKILEFSNGLSPPGANPDAARMAIAAWFDGYKKFEPDKWAKVTGWSDAAAAKAALDEVVEFYRVERSR